MFTARYELFPYIKHITFVFKSLMHAFTFLNVTKKHVNGATTSLNVLYRFHSFYIVAALHKRHILFNEVKIRV